MTNTPPAYHDELALELAKQIYGMLPVESIQVHAQRVAAIQVLIVEAFAKIAAMEQERIAAFTPTHRHIKGGLYQRLYVGLMEATLETAVIYRGGDGSVWIRPFANFNERFSALKDSKP